MPVKDKEVEASSLISETKETEETRIIEIPVEKESGLTVVRKRVPANIDPEDIPERARLLSVEESVAISKRASEPETIYVGDRVRRRPEKADPVPGPMKVTDEDQGFVDAYLKSKTEANKKFVRVRWERSNQALKEDPDNLLKIW